MKFTLLLSSSNLSFSCNMKTQDISLVITRADSVCAGERAVAYWGLSIIYPQFWDLLGSPRTVNTTLAPSTFLIGITSETHQHQALQHHHLWLIILYILYQIRYTVHHIKWKTIIWLIRLETSHESQIFRSNHSTLGFQINEKDCWYS